MDLFKNDKVEIKLENIGDAWNLTIKNLTKDTTSKFCAAEGISQDEIVSLALILAKFEDITVNVDFTKYK